MLKQVEILAKNDRFISANMQKNNIFIIYDDFSTLLVFSNFIRKN